MRQKNKFLSPAKVNLFFRVLSKREDGYHNIASLYQTVSLYDEIHIDFALQDHFTSSTKLPWDQSNLIYQALHLFRNKTGATSSFSVHLIKNIPIEAGLGGGSSNAATVLWALNLLTKANIDISTLAKWAEEIGSDVSFFFSTGTAYCRGRGEIFTDMPFQKKSIYIAKPAFGISTSSVYKRCDLSSTSTFPPEQMLASIYTEKPLYYNDLEKAAFSLDPRLTLFKKKLMQLGFSSVTMTGSGSAFICFGNPSHNQANHFLQNVLYVQRDENNWY